MATTTNGSNVALVAGAGGIIGHATAHELARQGWRVRALARRPVEGFSSVAPDFTDAAATAASLRRDAADTTHLFYAALSPIPISRSRPSATGGCSATCSTGWRRRARRCGAS
jgi:NAD(P)-dependent dehydrogenase (short-subunit alcohol dehydrogenase family)